MKRGELLTSYDYLKQLPSSIVFKYFLENTEIERKILSVEMVDAIYKEYFSQEAVLKRFDQLSAEARKVCALAYLFGGTGIRAMEFNEYHEQLLASFLLYAACDQQGIYYYFSFKDLETHLRDACAGVLVTLSACNTSVQSESINQLCCLQDFTNILILAFKGLLKRKQDGDIIQIAYTDLRNKLHSSQSSHTTAKKDKDIKRIVKFLLAFGIDRKFLFEDDKNYRTSMNAISAWLAMSLATAFDDVFNFAVHFIGCWNVELMHVMCGLSPGKWLSTSFVPVSCREQFTDILFLFHYLGLLEVETSSKETFFRSCAAKFSLTAPASSGQPEVALDKVVISSDFTAIVPQEALPIVIYRFSLLGSIVKLDQIYKGKVERENICESLSKGIDGDFLIQMLVQWHAPENVVETIREWIREFSRLYIINDSTIMVFDQKACNQISQYEPLSQLIEPVAPLAVFKIKNGCEEQVRAALTDMGYDPRMPHKTTFVTSSVDLPALHLPETEEEMSLVVDFNEKIKTLSHKLKSGKYSEELKELDKNELYHVIDYAILMGYSLKIEYEGSPYIRQGVYSIEPKKLVNGKDPVIEGTSETSSIVKRFYLKKIKKIGVQST
ncbi:MAG: hypothetical protein JW795_07890 [Chitinivibrionales bacterium]|nr:hypothetical protein [Chitinivibrionales bacterium]